jgi:hypothetical protein
MYTLPWHPFYQLHYDTRCPSSAKVLESYFGRLPGGVITGGDWESVTESVTRTGKVVALRF